MSGKPFCNWPVNEQGLVNVRDAVDPPGGCIIPAEVRGFFVQQLEAPASAGAGTLHTGTRNWKKPPARATVASTTRPKEAPVLAQVAPVPADAPQEAANAPLSASVPVPVSPSADDLARIAHGAGGGLNGIVLALLAAVGGGGAIWKYLQSKQKASAKKDELEHAERMKELDIQQQKSDDQHKACDTGRQELAMKLSALDERVTGFSFNVKELQTRLQELSSKLDGIQDSLVKLAALDTDELEERLAALELKAKPSAKTPAKRKAR